MLIRLYGPVEMDTGTSSHRIAAPKRACVLAALASAPGTPVSILDLITRVWGDDPPDAAVSTLYSYIARLRALLRHHSRLSVERLAPQRYVLHADPAAVDVHRVRELTVRARRHRDAGELAEAVTLWRRGCELARGEALVGVGGPWAARYRSELRLERLQLLTERYTAELDLGHHADAVGELADLVAPEPLFEPLIARYLLALYRCGRAAEALDRYEELRVRLRDHSGADPSGELRGLHQAILRQDASLDVADAPASPPPVPAARVAVPAQLPADAAGFHGRDAELAAVTARAGHGGVVVIDGMAGVGKTALALRAAHRLAPEYPDGQLFLDLHGYAENVAPTDPATALARLLRALDSEVTADDTEERAAALRTALAGRRMLLLLDNARDAEQVRPLLPGTAECLTIVTSRRRLVDLVDSRPVSLSTLPLGQAAELFAAEAEVNADAAALRVAELCGGLPLAVRIAASRLRHRPGWDAAELARRLGRGRSAIRELDGAGRGVTAAFDLSYQELDAVARRQFRLLSVFPGSQLDLGAAAALAGAEPDEAEPVLELLVDAQLLSGLGGSGYRMHDLLREYATQLVDAGEREEAWRRLAEHYVATAHAATAVVAPKIRALTLIKPTVDRDAPEDPVAWLHAQLPMLERLADNAMAAGDHDTARDLGMLAHGGLVNRYTPEETALRIGLAGHGERAAAMLGDLNAQADFAAQLGGIHIDLGQLDEARAALTRALEFWRAAGLPTGESVAHNSLARIDMRTGHLAAAVAAFEVSATLAESSERVVTNGAVSRMSAVGALVRLGRLGEARRLWERARAVLEPTGNQFELIRIGYFDGLIVQATGDHRAAEPLFRDALDRCERLRIPHFAVFAIAALTENRLRLGAYAEAAESAHRQLDLVGSADLSATFEAEALRQLGTARTGLGEHGDALTELLAAEQLARAARNELELADVARALGDLYRAQGELAEARRAYRRALDFYTDGGFPDAEEVRRALASCDG